jgi:rhodanese-related sulfurtransferase
MASTVFALAAGNRAIGRISLPFLIKAGFPFGVRPLAESLQLKPGESRDHGKYPSQDAPGADSNSRPDCQQTASVVIFGPMDKYDRQDKSKLVPNPTRKVMAPKVSLLRRMAGQLAAILGLSVALGITFNAANPIGVRFAIAAPGEGADGAVPKPAPAPAVTQALPPKPVPAPESVSPPPPPSPAPVSTIAIAPTNRPAPVAAGTNPVAAAPQPPAPMPIATHWKEVKSLLAATNVVLVDVRPKGIYDAGHIPGALSLPEGSPPAEFDAFVTRYPTNTAKLILYCSSTSCSMSLRVAKRMMSQYNYTSVKYMTGGYQEYQREEMGGAPAAAPALPPAASTNMAQRPPNP